MIEFIENMTINNSHIFWHLMGGLLFGKIFSKMLYNNSTRAILVWVFAVAVIFEIIELYLNGGISIYGSTMRYIADTSADVIGAVLFAWVITK